MAEKISGREAYLWLAFFVFILIVHTLIAFTGHFGYEDIHFAKLANDLYHGNLPADSNYGKPWPLLIVTGFFYSIFGVSDFASVLSSLVVSAAILGVVFAIVKHMARVTVVSALALATFNNWLLFYSNKLVPDLYVALAVVFVLFVLHQYKFRAAHPKPLVTGPLIAIGLIVGFSAKNTMMLFLPLLLYFAITDLIRKRHLTLWMYTGLSILALGGIYFLVISGFSGDAQGATFHAARYINVCSYADSSSDALTTRLLYRFFEMMLMQGMLVGVGIILASVYYVSDKNFFLFEDEKGFFSLSAILLLLSSNLMTVSVKGYVPMCTDPLYYLFIIPVTAIAAGMHLNDFYLQRKRGLIIAALFLIFTIVSLLLPGKAWFQQYLPFFIFALIFTFLPEKRKTHGLFIVLLLLMLGINMVGKAQYGANVRYSKQKEIVENELLGIKEPAYVITDKVQKRFADYFTGFDTNHPVKFLSFNTFSFDTLAPNRPVYLLNNWHTAYLSGLEKKGLPYFARVLHPSTEVIFESETPDIKIYRLNQIILPELIFENRYGFEKADTLWQQDKNNIFQFNAATGEYSYRVKEFSATFEAPISAMNPDSLASKLLINASVKVRTAKPSDARLVISVQTDSASLAYHTARLGEFIHTYGDWWPCSQEMIFNMENFHEGATLKVYVHNPEAVNLYVDDFSVKVFQIIE